MKPAYSGNSSLYRVLVQDNLNKPEGLALDPVDGFMFFSDNEPNGRITRASLDGENATVIVYRGLVRVSSLTVDPDNDLLLWADTVRFTVEMCQYDGSHRRVVRRANLVSFAGLQFYQNVLHVVDPGNRFVRGLDMLSGVLVYDSYFTMGTPSTLAVYDTENVPSILDPCSSEQCGQICVNTPSGPVCLCHEGHDLVEDGSFV
nr:low-density lipoprotein receptor-related protein 4-like [Crassostrea gigas]